MCAIESETQVMEIHYSAAFWVGSDKEVAEFADRRWVTATEATVSAKQLDMLLDS